MQEVTYQQPINFILQLSILINAIESSMFSVKFNWYIKKVITENYLDLIE